MSDDLGTRLTTPVYNQVSIQQRTGIVGNGRPLPRQGKM
jgi:hypothetical protein